MKLELIHGSRADCALACSGSIAEPQHPINIGSEAANLGTAIHVCCAQVPLGLTPDVDRIGREYDVSPKELSIMTYYAQQAWDEVRQYFPDPQTEVKLKGPVTIGTCDVLAMTPTTLAFLDWKSGRVSDEHPGQLMAYADAARAQFWEPDGEIIGVEVWLRDQELRVYRFSNDQLNGFRRKMARQIGRAGKEYAPGSHCRFCSHVAGCEPREQYIRSTCDALASTAQDDLTERQNLAALWVRSRDLKSALTSYESAVGEALLEGPLDLGEGRQLERRVSEIEKLDAGVSIPVLQSLGLSEGQIYDCLKMSKSGALGALRDNLGESPPRGSIGRSKKKAMEMLRDAGAVTTSPRIEKKIVKV